MARTTYEVSLSTDGVQFVTVRGDDSTALKAAVRWATVMLGSLAHDGQAAAQDGARGAPPEAASRADEPATDAAPVCAVHHQPMVRVQGRRGPFWSCHQRNEDGSFCSYRPQSIE